YCIELRGPAVPGAHSCFEAPFENEPVPFSVILPVPANFTAVAITHNGQDVLVRTASASAPTMEITAPAPGALWQGGEQNLTWTANDADGGALPYTVLASTDGGATYAPLAIGIETQQHTIDAG